MTVLTVMADFFLKDGSRRKTVSLLVRRTALKTEIWSPRMPWFKCTTPTGRRSQTMLKNRGGEHKTNKKWRMKTVNEMKHGPCRPISLRYNLSTPRWNERSLVRAYELWPTIRANNHLGAKKKIVFLSTLNLVKYYHALSYVLLSEHTLKIKSLKTGNKNALFQFFEVYNH